MAIATRPGERRRFYPSSPVFDQPRERRRLDMSSSAPHAVAHLPHVLQHCPRAGHPVPDASRLPQPGVPLAHLPNPQARRRLGDRPQVGTDADEVTREEQRSSPTGKEEGGASRRARRSGDGARP
jgi:hypothetical protein